MPIQPRASTRLSLQWPPAPATEETDTLVLTFPEHYLDLRVFRAGHAAEGQAEWVQAGDVVPSSESTSIEFKPLISSIPPPPPHIPHLPDLGAFETLPNGDVLERGMMYNPAAGKNAPYLETWRRLPLPTPPRSFLLRSARENVLAFVGYVGEHALGVARVTHDGAERFLAYRETLDALGVWRRVYTIGRGDLVDRFLPSINVLPDRTDGEWVVLHSST